VDQNEARFHRSMSDVVKHLDGIHDSLRALNNNLVLIGNMLASLADIYAKTILKPAEDIQESTQSLLDSTKIEMRITAPIILRGCDNQIYRVGDAKYLGEKLDRMIMYDTLSSSAYMMIVSENPTKCIIRAPHTDVEVDFPRSATFELNFQAWRERNGID
jgi:hypothetical protein